MNLFIGHVKWFSSEQKVGIITPSNGGEDVFVHSNNKEKFIEGQAVTYQIENGRRGPRASIVKIQNQIKTLIVQ